MLRELTIKNFAIIDDLHIQFSEGLTILSGETGAGKSIIINAINLLIGSRATSKMIRTGTKAAELEAMFDIQPDSPIPDILNEQGIETEDGLIIRRIISANDRHRVYINGRLATMGMLSLITDNLASISGQHAHQRLLKEDTHLLLLDQYGNLMPLRNEISTLYHDIVPLMKQLQNLKDQKLKLDDQIAFLEYQQQEIINANITLGEDEDLEKERTKLQHAEMLFQVIHESLDVLYDHDGAVIEQLGKINKKIEKVAMIDPELENNSEQINQSIAQIEDITENLRSYLNGITIDEGRCEIVNDRIDLLQRLKRKYGPTLDQILTHLDAVQKELETIQHTDDQIESLENELQKRHKILAERAIELSRQRKEKAAILSNKVEAELAELKMTNTQFRIMIDHQPIDKQDSNILSANGYHMSETGIDKARFMIAPNIGEAMKPLSQIASGGELSRVVLALKAILAENETVSTIVFDEVDAGIGGGVAEIVGKKIMSLAQHHQVICITHLAQIAKFGHHHYCITKTIENNRTKTTIQPLTAEERIKEIARMIGGTTITQATLDHANEMLHQSMDS